MRWLWPEWRDGEISEDELERLYSFPVLERGRPWIAVNFVASADGAVTVAGHSERLSSSGDKRIFLLGRELSDVVLVGAGTALIEGYGGVRATARLVERRARHGLAGVPPIAVVTRSCSLRPDAPLIASAHTPTIVLTCEAAPETRRDALAAAGADVVITGTSDVDPHACVKALAERGLYRVCCEGGPRLFGTLIGHDLVDELRLTVSPLLAGGDAGRIAQQHAGGDPVALELASVLTDDGWLMTRYLVRR